MASAKDVIRLTNGAADMIVNAYISDLSDEELLIPPAEGANSIAWQLGHLLAAQHGWIEKLAPGAAPALPEGFAAAHGKETASPNSFKPVCSKDEYMRIWKEQSDAVNAALDAVGDAALDAETGVAFAPTGAALLNMIGVHALMHAGQFAAVRRKLGKPVVI